MSVYKILYKRRAGRESWEVFYKERPLEYCTPRVLTDCGYPDTNPYDSLDNARKVIKSHKRFMEMYIEENRENTTKWLSEDGVPIPQQVMEVLPDDGPPNIMTKVCVAIPVLAVIIATGILYYIMD